MRVFERYPAWMRVYRGGPLPALVSPFLRGLSRLYGLHLFMRRRTDGAGRPDRSLGGGARIISVGNLEVGGGGKTPCVMALVEALGGRDQRPVVVTRGYGSEAERTGSPIVVSAGTPIGEEGLGFISSRGLGERVVGFGGDRDALARFIGDEVVLYRRRGIPVVVDKRRTRGIEIAERVFAPTHIILDDAFQHRGAPRDIDIVLLDASRPFGNGRLVPAGSLREQPQALERADVIIFTRAQAETVPREATGIVAGKPVFFASHLPVEFVKPGGEQLPLDHLRGERVALISGIARPESFEETVRSIGIEPEASFRFADHHDYTERDITWIRQRTHAGCTLVTTEKDWVKAAHLFPPGAGPLALVIRMEIRGLERLLDRIGGRDGIPAGPAAGGNPTSS